VAVVTGAGSGIGRAVAVALAGKGFVVVVVGRTAGPLEETAGLLAAAGGRGVPMPADVSKREQVEEVIRRTAGELGRVDVLVNNAGFAPAVPIAELSPEVWREILDTNLSSVFYATRAAWPVMAGQAVSPVTGARGVIVNISSMASKDPFPGLGAYGVAKAGVNLLSLATAREGQAAGIRVLCVAPAAVETPMFRQLVAGMGGPEIPTETILRPEDVAGVVMEGVMGALRHCAGETVFVHRPPA
jgi:NAD(P)-dependent dehydrogenase (short-subunit alcohol dehydrogenase family)